MPTIGWIDALRQYNAGMPSWCVPRKGTPGYESVMRIRRGEEKAKSFKEVLDELETKTSGKPKGEKKSMKIDLTTQSATLPTIQNDAAKTDRPPTKSSVPTHKTMAVIEPTYVAEGGSKKEALSEMSHTDLIELRSRLEKEYLNRMRPMDEKRNAFSKEWTERYGKMTRKEIDDAREEDFRLSEERSNLHEATRETLGLPAVEAELHSREKHAKVKTTLDRERKKKAEKKS